jgi:hypothetical protein
VQSRCSGLKQSPRLALADRETYGNRRLSMPTTPLLIAFLNASLPSKILLLVLVAGLIALELIPLHR